MTDDKAHDVIAALVHLSEGLAGDHDALELFTRLTTSCTDSMDVEAAGLLLADAEGVLHLAASSSEKIAQLELFQLQRTQGPCRDCYDDGRGIVVPDLAAQEQRWPLLVRAAHASGYQSAHAFPLRLKGKLLGTLGLFRESAGRLDRDDIALAQALLDVASVAVVSEEAASDHYVVNSQLQRTLAGRIVLEQAKGIIAQSGGLSIDDAYTALREHARAHQQKLGEVASRIVQGALSADAVSGSNGSASPTTSPNRPPD